MPLNTSATGLNPIIIQPPGSVADATIIWMHGLGADGSDFVGIVDQLCLPVNHSIKFIFPHAPYRPIAINAGMAMRGWYNLFSLNLVAKEDITGILKSNQQIGDLIEQELAAGIKPERIILAGFSQGGAMALYIGLRFNRRLGGIIALSTYQLVANKLADERNPANQDIPIFLAHGMFDPVVGFNLGQDAQQQLVDLAYNVEWHTYPMQHTLLPEEIQHIGDFIHKVLAS